MLPSRPVEGCALWLTCCFLGSHSTFSAEAPTQRPPGLSQPASYFYKDHLPSVHGKSTAGMSGKNVPIDMYIPSAVILYVAIM